MLVLLYYACQAASDIAIPIFALQIIIKQKVRLNNYLYLLLFLFLFLVVLNSFYSINYLYIEIPLFILILLKNTKGSKGEKEIAFPIVCFIIMNIILLPIINIVYFYLFNGFMDFNFSFFGIFGEQKTEFFIKMILILILFYIQNINMNSVAGFKGKYCRYSNVFIVICYIVFISFMVISISYKNENIFVLLSMLSSLIITLVFIFNNLYLNLYENIINNQSLILENEKQKLQLAGFLESQKFVEEMRKFKHDMKNNFIIIEHMIQYKEYLEASSYLKKYINRFENVQRTIQIDNLIASAIINDKVWRYPQLGFDVRCFIPKSLFIKDIDFAIILGNILDNACEYLTRENLYSEILIKITAVYETDLFIEVINFCKELEITSNFFESKKERTIAHGYGIINVKNTIEKYDGFFNSKIEESNFIIQILIPEGVKKNDKDQ